MIIICDWLTIRLSNLTLTTLVNGSPPGDLGIRIVSMNTNPIRNSSRPFYSPYIVLPFTNRKLFYNLYRSKVI